MNSELNIISPSSRYRSLGEGINNNTLIADVNNSLKEQGYVLLRDFDSGVENFSQLIGCLVERLTLDPARQFVGKNTQKVDAGYDEIGLHIENGNTPFPPDVVAFLSVKSASIGSQTTVCDGAELLKNMPLNYRQLFSQNITVSRTLPEKLWKTYVANELSDINSSEEVTTAHLEKILALSNNHQSKLNDDGTLLFNLEVAPILSGNYANIPAFANAILGPSINYQKPIYSFADGSLIDDTLINEIARLAENFTLEIPWQDGDIAVIDNKRVMHGRRKIKDKKRELFIAMGSN